MSMSTWILIRQMVSETDADGNALDESSVLEYDVSVDHARITMSPSENEQTVVITNTYPEEKKEKPNAPSGNTYTGRSGSSTRTGDDTPILFYSILLAAAAVGVLVIWVFKKKKR